MVLAIATIKDQFKKMTVNLAAPVVINVKENLGKQVILDREEFPVKYQLFADKKQEDVKEMIK
jgi:flagellar assembly factor FliW